MTYDDIAKIILALLERDIPEYGSPSGSVIKQIRNLIKEGKIEEASLAYCVLRNVSQANGQYVLARFPSMIINHYPPIRDKLDRLSGAEKIQRSDEWAIRIRAAAAEAGQLRMELAQIVAELQGLPSPGREI